ncbi:MAG: glycosyltransferase family 4 protein [Deltaproteobacteria bacterium]|nr:glycosyltransferase family 4 protein [Deltaproteobacteria bacterium]
MRILHINTEKTWRGGEQQCLYLLQGLKERDIDCRLICQPNSPLERRAKDSKLDFFCIPMRGEVDLTAAFQIRNIISKYGYKIIHSHTSHAHTLAFFASAGIKTTRLVTRRVDFSIFRHSFLRLSGIKYRYMADYYIAISHKIKEVLIVDGISANRIFVVHSGIDPQRFAVSSSHHLVTEFDIKNDERIVLNVAHLANHKGQEHLVKAIPFVLKEIPRTRFFIVGGGELKGELKKLAAALRLDRKVVFTGFREDIDAFYNIADLFVMSSVQEGLGTAILDAMALGIPVVATTAGGIPESIQDGKTGRLVTPGSNVALARGIVEALKHPEQASQMAHHGKAMVRDQFSVGAMVDKNVRVYRKFC